MLDYIVVGLGLAGISFCEVLESEGKTHSMLINPRVRASLRIYQNMSIKQLLNSDRRLAQRLLVNLAGKVTTKQSFNAS